MNTRKTLLTFFLSVLFLFSLQTSAIAKDTWLKVRSQNFTLIGNAKEKKIREVATKLEQFRYVFTRLFPNMKFTSPIPTTVIVFKSERAFNPYRDTKWTAGYFLSRDDINYIALYTGRDKASTYNTIFHEYIHFLIDNNLGRSRVPPWFNEGIAEYYDQFSIKDDKVVTLGGLNNNHLRSLQNTKLIPFEVFFNIDYYSLNRQGSHSANIFYAQSWALMHYLMQGNGGKRSPQLRRFLNLVMTGKEPKEAFQSAFQTDYASMEKELRRYVRQNRFKISIATAKNKIIFDDKMETLPMTQADSNAYLGDLLYRGGNLKKAEVKLNEALALDANSSIANTSMGLLKMRQNKFDEAKSYLEKAVNSDSKNYRILYNYAYVLSREGRGEGGYIRDFPESTANKMREALKKAIAIKPDFPRSYDLMAYISLVRNENLDEGIGYLRKALSISPGNQNYMLNLANLYLRKREFNNAIAIVESVYKTADKPSLRSYASSLLNQLKQVQKQIAEAKKNGYEIRERNSGRPPSLGRRIGTPPSKEEQLKMRERAKMRFINRNLRKPEDGEKRILGSLSKIACSGRKITYTVKTKDKLLKFQSKDFRGLHLVIYDEDVGNIQIGCGTLKKEYFSVITYKPNAKPKSKYAGDIVGIEIVPKNFTFTEEN